MNIAVIGASGKADSLILKEAVNLGHQVTAIVRNAAKHTDKTINVIEKDISALSTADVNPLFQC